jgi:hypothetical protein
MISMDSWTSVPMVSQRVIFSARCRRFPGARRTVSIPDHGPPTIPTPSQARPAAGARTAGVVFRRLHRSDPARARLHDRADGRDSSGLGARARRWSGASPWRTSAGKPSAVQQRIIGRQRKPVGRPDRRRLANYSRLRRVGETCATQSISFARQVAASRARFPRMRFLVMGHVLAPRTVWPQRLSVGTCPPVTTC